MKALLFSDTRNDGDRTCNLPDILAMGDTAAAQSIVEAFSDDLALLMEDWDNCTFHLWGTDKEEVEGSEISFAEVVEKFLSKECGEISVDTPDTCRCPSYSLNWAIRDVPVSPSSRLRVAYAKAMADIWDKDADLCSYAGVSDSEAYRRRKYWEKVAEYWKEN